MNILLSSYSCNPYKGSEDGIGWHWTLELSKSFPSDTIYLITKKANEKDTKKGIEEAELKNVKLIISDLPYCLNWYREKNSAFHHIYYIAWQNLAYRRAKKLNVHFDVVHHITMNDFRISGKMYKFKDSYTIFGPIGGGQSTPKALKEYEGNKLVSTVRELINKSTKYRLFYNKNIKSFDKIYTINNETADCLSHSVKSERLFELALASELRNLNISRTPESPVKLMFMGRFIAKKGVIFMLDIVDKIAKDKDFVLYIYGVGPLKEKMQGIIESKSLENKVKIIGKVDYNKISEAYKNADIFLMPSLRETSGNVIIEAMAHKLPITALDMSICSIIKEHDCGLFVNTDQSKEKIISDFAKNLETLIDDCDLRKRLGENGYSYVNRELTWDSKVKTIYAKFIKE